MLATLLVTIVAVGAVVSYFVSKFSPRVVFAVSYALMATGIVLACFSADCIGQTDGMIERLRQSGDFNTIPYTPYAWLDRWVEPYFLTASGILLAFFGFGACSGFALRKTRDWLKN